MKNYSKNLTLMLKAAEKSHMIFQRDYREIEMLQSSSNGTERFALKTLEKVNNVIFEYFSRIFGEDNIVSIDKFDESPRDDCFCFAIDGFANFTRSLPYFSLTIGYINKSGFMESALIFCPALFEYYIVEERQGAWKESINGTGNSAVRLKISKKSNNHELFLSFNKNRENNDVFFNKNNLNMINCESLSLAYLAGGKIDVHYLSNSIFFKKLSELFVLETFAFLGKNQDDWIISNSKYF